MTKLPVDQLIEGLEEWNNRRDTNKATDYLSLLTMINFNVGSDTSKFMKSDADIQTNLEILRERILELSNKQHINQVVLVEGIISNITRYFTSGYKIIVRNLILNEKFSIKSKNITKIVEKFKKTEYRVGVELDEQVWNEIVSKRFSKYCFDSMENEILLKDYKDNKNMIDNIPEEDKDLTMGQLLRKYNK